MPDDRNPRDLTNSAEVAAQLRVLHEDINNCTKCAIRIPEFVKIRGIRRGEAGSIVIVGQSPGRHEKDRLEAFAGPSGKRLEGWLIACGANKANPRKGIYFTSVVKCVAPQCPSKLHVMARNCQPFLFRQLAVLGPRLVMTLGQLAYEAISPNNTPYGQALCRPIRTEEAALFTGRGFTFTLLPWPHPSPLNRWHNDSRNVERLRASFNFVRPFFQDMR